MRILLFTENTHAGGLDTFIATLIRNWPVATDEWVLTCNASHPGLDGLAKRLPANCTVRPHTMPLYIDLLRRTAKSRPLTFLRRLVGPAIRYGFFLYHLVALRRVLSGAAADYLLIVNGGHPGGDSCRAAAVVWHRLGGRAALYNFHNFATPPRWFEAPIENLLDAWLERSTCRLVSVSRICAESLRVRPALRVSEKIGFIYNGIEAGPEDDHRGTADIRGELGIPGGSRLCLMLATYEPRKGHAFLLEAFSRVVSQVQDVHLLICGYGYPDEVLSVERQVEALGIGAHVHLRPFRADIAVLLRQSDILAVPSQSFESFGLVCVEAMAQRVPVVATSVGGIPEVVADGEGGYCVAPDDVGGFATRMIDLLADEALRKEQGQRGYARYRRLFQAERMAADYAALIRGDTVQGMMVSTSRKPHQ